MYLFPEVSLTVRHINVNRICDEIGLFQSKIELCVEIQAKTFEHDEFSCKVLHRCWYFSFYNFFDYWYIKH